MVAPGSTHQPRHIASPPPLSRVSSLPWPQKEELASAVWGSMTAALRREWENNKDDFVLTFCRKPENLKDEYECLLDAKHREGAGERARRQRDASGARTVRLLKERELDAKAASGEDQPIEKRLWNKLPDLREDFQNDFNMFQALYRRDPSEFSEELKQVTGSATPPQSSSRPSERITVDEEDARRIWKNNSSLRNEFGAHRFNAFLSAFKAKPDLFYDEILDDRSAV